MAEGEDLDAQHDVAHLLDDEDLADDLGGDQRDRCGHDRGTPWPAPVQRSAVDREVAGEHRRGAFVDVEEEPTDHEHHARGGHREQREDPPDGERERGAERGDVHAQPVRSGDRGVEPQHVVVDEIHRHHCSDAEHDGNGHVDQQVAALDRQPRSACPTHGPTLWVHGRGDVDLRAVGDPPDGGRRSRIVHLTGEPTPPSALTTPTHRRLDDRVDTDGDRIAEQISTGAQVHPINEARPLLLAEQLALLASRTDRHRPPLGGRNAVNACLAGLLLAELRLEDRPSSTVLDEAAIVLEERGPKLGRVLSSMDRDVRKRTGRGTWDLITSGLDLDAIEPRAGLVTRSVKPRRVSTRCQCALRCCCRSPARRGCWRSSLPSARVAGACDGGSTTRSTAARSRTCAAPSSG